MRVTDEMLARARARKKGQASTPFVVAQHPPGVVPAGVPTMAQDDAISSSLNWAANSYGSQAFSDGLVFLGYNVLAELAQRPEYRVISETIATEMTRRWIKIFATGEKDKTDKIGQLGEAMSRLGVQDAFRRVAQQDGFFGRGHIYVDLGTTDNLEELKTTIGDGRNNISRSKIAKGSLQAVRTVEAVWCYPTAYNSANPLAPDWYRPASWLVQGRQIHSSRLLTFIGREVPDILKPAYSFGGLSMSQMAKPYVDNWIKTRQSVSDLISRFSVSGVKLKLAEAINTDGGGSAVFKRVEFFNDMRDNLGTMVLNTDEEFFNVSTPLGTLDKLQAQAQEHLCSVSRVPLVKLTGISPSGLNATSEGELICFEDWIHAYQELLFRPNLDRIFGLVQLSEFGEVDPSLGFGFEPLRNLDEERLAALRKTEADTDTVHINNGTITPAEARQRVAADDGTPYAGLDADTAPTLSAVEKADVDTKVSAVLIGAFEESLFDKAQTLTAWRDAGLPGQVTDQMLVEAALEPPAPVEGLPEPPQPGGGPSLSPEDKGSSEELSLRKVIGAKPAQPAQDKATFEEAKHPRASNGKFGSGGSASGGSASTPDQAKQKVSAWLGKAPVSAALDKVAQNVVTKVKDREFVKSTIATALNQAIGHYVYTHDYVDSDIVAHAIQHIEVGVAVSTSQAKDVLRAAVKALIGDRKMAGDAEPEGEDSEIMEALLALLKELGEDGPEQIDER